jgi:NAD(P)H-nitrite reductase large subunit
MAGWSILRRRGEISEGEYERRMAPLRRERAGQIGWGRTLHQICRLPQGAWRSIPDRTVVCRCEDVTAGDLRRRIVQGFDTFGSLKKATRCGMGMCQGRTCGPILMEMLAAPDGRVPPPDGPVPVRVPVKPVRLSALAGREVGRDSDRC